LPGFCRSSGFFRNRRFTAIPLTPDGVWAHASL
jgi:hypothetical protein